MLALGAYLIYAAVVLRAAVVLSATPEFTIIIALLTSYGGLLFGKSWLLRQRQLRSLQFKTLQSGYLVLQSALVIALLIGSTYEDFLAMLFVPLSLDAVSLLGQRHGFRSIALFSLALTSTLLFSHAGPLFGLAMGILYSGVCFLVGGYAYQVQKARAAREQNELMFRDLQTAYHQLEGNANQLASLAIEQERNRLARELHDSVTQTVFSMNLAAQSAYLLLDKSPLLAAQQLLRLEELAANAQKEIQSLVSQLKPPTVVEGSLPAALRQLAREQKLRDGLHVRLEITGEQAVPETVSAGLYSIAHEALVNVSRHSGVCEAVVRLHLDRSQSWLEIEDHGRGFDPGSATNQRGHLGVAGMLERAREIGWDLSVSSRPGHGTCIRVTQRESGCPR